MPRFLIEVPHEGTFQGCARAIELFLKTGSHFLTHADWGCKDGVHKAWMTVELDSRDEALGIVPTQYRADARVVELTGFTTSDLGRMLGERRH